MDKYLKYGNHRNGETCSIYSTTFGPLKQY